MANKIWVLMRSFAVAACFIALQIYFLPRWFGLPRAGSLAASPWRLLALVPCAMGAGLMLVCVWDFGVKGRGTPAPFDAPRLLVTSGPYGYVRNPMYLGMGLFLAGEAVLLTTARAEVFLYGAALVLITNLFVRFYEEPALRGKFGAEYTDYCAHVRRWAPRLKPYRP